MKTTKKTPYFMATAALIGLMAGSVPAFAQDVEKIRISPAIQSAEAGPSVNSGVMTSDITEDSFPEALRNARANAEKPDATEFDKVELARVYLGAGMMHEAAQLVAGLLGSGKPMDPAAAQMARAIALAASLSGAPGTDAAEAAYADTWDENSIWPSLARIKLNNGAVDTLDIRKAATGLGTQSPQVIAQIFPVMFDAAITSRDKALVKDLIRAAKMDVATEGSSQMHFMEGQYYLLNDQGQNAFDSFVAAMAADDIYGIRARIALADIVLKRPNRTHMHELHDILADGIRIWKADAYALQMMIRLAGITEELANAPAALRTMTKIIATWPDTNEAELARERIPVILTAFTISAAEGRTSFETYLSTLRELERGLEVFPEWYAARTTLAELFTARGLHEAAAAEYKALRYSGSLGPKLMANQNASMVATLEAEALLENDRIGEAYDVVSGSTKIFAGEAEAKRLLISIKSGAAEIRNLDLTTLDDDQILAVAQVGYGKKDWETTAKAYARLISAGKDLSENDFSRYLHAQSVFAKNRNTDFAAPQHAYEKAESLSAAAEAYLWPLPDLSRLSTETAQLMLDKASSAGEAAKKIISEKP